jgi:hypothetical protein
VDNLEKKKEAAKGFNLPANFVSDPQKILRDENKKRKEKQQELLQQSRDLIQRGRPTTVSEPPQAAVNQVLPVPVPSVPI